MESELFTTTDFCQGRAKLEGRLAALLLHGPNWRRGMSVSQMVGSAGDANLGV